MVIRGMMLAVGSGAGNDSDGGQVGLGVVVWGKEEEGKKL